MGVIMRALERRYGAICGCDSQLADAWGFAITPLKSFLSGWLHHDGMSNFSSIRPMV